MSDVHLADAVLRQFLLGKVDDQQRQGVETLFLTDTTFNERLLSLEQELIDDYFEGALSREDTESFRRQFERTASQKKKLGVSKSVKVWANEQLSKEAREGLAKDRPSGRFFRPFIVVPVVAALLIITVLLIVWTRYRAETRRHGEMQQELVRMNRPQSLAETPSGLISLTLSPVNTRTVDAQASIESVGTQPIELKLLWIRDNVPSYRAELRGLTSDVSFAVENLQTEGNLVRLRIPAQLLARGQFRVTLTGMSGSSSQGFSEEYWFSVKR